MSERLHETTGNHPVEPGFVGRTTLIQPSFRYTSTLRMGCEACPNKREISLPIPLKLSLETRGMPLQLTSEVVLDLNVRDELHTMPAQSSSLAMNNKDCNSNAGICSYEQRIDDLYDALSMHPDMLSIQVGELCVDDIDPSTE